MSGFVFAFVAVLLTSLGSHDQLLVARYSAHFGRDIRILLLGSAIAFLTAAAMAWGGYYISSIMPPNGKMMLVALALVFAAAELAWPIRKKPLREPTRSLGALGLVLIYRQLADGSRFLIFAFAAGSALPFFAGAGGAIAGVIAILLGWLLAEDLIEKAPLRAIRITLAIITLVAAIYIGLTARGLL